MRRLVRHKMRMISSPQNPRQNKVMDQPRRLVLASGSRYRKELLERLGLRFELAAPALDEAALPNESPAHTALRLAELKAKSQQAAYRDALIIGSDQVAASGARRYGKPGNHQNATQQLRELSGKAVDFHTAVSLLDAGTGDIQTRLVPCRVVFRTLHADQIERYLQ